MTENETKWSERVAEWRASGQEAREYAEGKGFAPTTLRWWASRLGRATTEATGEKPASHVRMARVVAAPSKPPGEPLVVRVGGVGIEVRAGFDATTLRDVVAALGAAS